MPITDEQAKALAKGTAIYRVWWTDGTPRGVMERVTVRECRTAPDMPLMRPWILADPVPKQERRVDVICNLADWSLTEKDAWIMFRAELENGLKDATIRMQEATNHISTVLDEYLRVLGVLRAAT